MKAAMILFLPLGVICLGCLFMPGGQLLAATNKVEVLPFTDPSADILLGFTLPGRVSEMLVKEGDRVKAGQRLIQLDNRVEMLRLLQMEAQAMETSQVEASKASLDQKKVDLKKIEWAAERGSATKLELEHARLDVRIAELSHGLARFEQAQHVRKYEEAKASLERMAMVSPIDGRVERVEIEVGESVNAFTPVVRVVKTDPLWINVQVSADKVKGLKVGQRADVHFVDADEKATGKIIVLSSVIDSASNTLRVRVEMPNPKGRLAGEQVRVEFAR